MATKPRIAVFDEYRVFDLKYPILIHPDVDDKPSYWAKNLEEPKLKIYKPSARDFRKPGFFRVPSYFNKEDKKFTKWKVDDKNAEWEVHRLIKFKTCPICRLKMTKMNPEDFYNREAFDNEELTWRIRVDLDIEELFCFNTFFICLHCGYWGGQGGENMRKSNVLGVLGRYSPLEPISENDSSYLISHLKKFPMEMNNISSRRAEKFVMDLLKDYLNCEVRPIGGTRDGGIDGFILRGNKIKSIVQIKWREDINKAESVNVVREVGGTLLARNIPSGIIVSNRIRFSNESKKEATNISNKFIFGLGKIKLELMDYHNILDMLEISNTRLTKDMSVKDWIGIKKLMGAFSNSSYCFPKSFFENMKQ